MASPEKDNQIETLELDSLDLGIPKNKTGKIIGTPYRIKDIQKERRINIYHYVIHTLAFMVVLPFLGMVVLGIEVPAEYSTIVAVVIGFYFGRSLFNN